jgi:hypothetical protein
VETARRKVLLLVVRYFRVDPQRWVPSLCSERLYLDLVDLANEVFPRIILHISRDGYLVQ